MLRLLHFPPRIAISVCFLLRGFIQGSWYPRIPGVVKAIEVNQAQMGLIFFLFALGNIVAFALSARIISRIGSAKTFVLWGIAYPLIVVAMSSAPNPILLGIGMFSFGLFAGSCDLASSVQGAVVERQTHAPLLSALYGLFSVGALAGAASSGIIAQANIPVQVQFSVMWAVMLPVTVLCFLGMLPDDVVSAAPIRRARRLSLPAKALWPLGLSIVCIALGEETVNNWVALYLREHLDQSAAIASTAFVAFSIATAVGRLFGDRVLSAVGVDRTLKFGSVLAAFGMGGSMLINQPWSVILGYTLVGIGLSVVVPVTYRRANQIPGVMPAQAVATVATIGFLGFLIGPLIVGTIADVLSLRVAISMVAACMLGIFVLTGANPTSRTPVNATALGHEE